MKFRFLGAAAILLMTTSFAQAAFDVDAVTQQFLSDGFTRIEVKIGPTQAKVEAINGTTKLEVIYDLATGEILKSETETVRADENTTPGVFVRNDDDDFLGGRDDDGDDDDHGGRGSDDDGDDDSDDNSRHSGDGDDDDNSGPGSDNSGHGGDDDSDD